MNLSNISALQAEIESLAQQVELLTLQKAKYQKLFEVSADALSILDLDTGRFVECNQSAIDMHGVGSEENFLNLTPDKISPEFQPCGGSSEAMAIERIQKTFSEGPQLFKWTHSRLDGSTFPCLVSLAALPLPDKNYVLAIGRDITELVATELRLEEEKKNAELAYQAKSDFLSNMSHEIRTPMNGILGMVDALKETELNGEQKKIVNILSSSGTTLIRILNDILDINKIEAGKVIIEEVNFNLHEALAEVVNLLRWQKTNINVDLSLIENSLANQIFLGDVTRIKQVATNLISNALKFTTKGSVTISTQVELIESHTYNIEIHIKDTGVGIESDKHDLLFNAFTQADQTITRKYGGTGLGLTISNSLAKLMGGSIGFTSKVNEGSDFYLSIILKGSDETVQVENKTKSNLSFDNKVLLVEDNEVNKIVATRLLKKYGLRYSVANDGYEALDLMASDDSYEIIFMDLQMPVMDGIEATRKIIQKYGDKAPPIIAMTANALQESKDECLAAGMVGYLMKPINKAELENTLLKYLKPSTSET